MTTDPQSSDSESRAQLAVLWTKAQTPTLAYIRSLIRNRDDADDILQQTAYTVAKRFGDYDPARPFLPWVIGVARLKVMEQYRRNQRLPNLLSPQVISDVAGVYEELGPELNGRASMLEACLDTLNGKSRALIQMRYRQDMKPAAIADKLGTTANTISNALSRIRAALRRCLEHRLSG